MKNIAVCASGLGSNFQAIADAVKKGRIKANLALLVCDNPQSYCLVRANKAKVPVALIEAKNFADRASYDKCVAGILKKAQIDLVILAGFMRVLSPYFVKAFKNKILNIHPALLPSFKGAHAIKDALKYGVKVTGVTVHFVDEKMDHGPIILQEALEIKPGDTENSLAQRIHKIEHRLYPKAVQLVLSNQIKLKGRKALIS